MEKTQGKIGIKEFVAIILLTVGTKLSDNTPNILYEDIANAAWLSIFLICLIWLIPLVLLIKLNTLYKDKNLIEIIQHLFGKYLGFAILFICWFMQTYVMFYNSVIYPDIIKTMYFNNTPLLVIALVLMAVTSFGAMKGLESIGSTAWITLIVIKISLIMVLVITFLQGEMDFIYPLLGEGGWKLIKESYNNSSIFTEFLYIFFIASSIKNTKVFTKGLWIGYIFVSIEFILALVGYVMIFDYYGIRLLDYPYHETIRYIQLGFLTNVELFFFPFWIVASFIRLSFYLYLSALLFGALFKIKQFQYIVPTLATISVFLGLIPQSITFSIDYLREIFLQIITPFVLSLPLILWITAKLKGELKK